MTSLGEHLQCGVEGIIYNDLSCLHPEAVTPDSDGTDVVVQVPLHAAHAAADVDVIAVVLAARILLLRSRARAWALPRCSRARILLARSFWERSAFWRRSRATRARCLLARSFCCLARRSRTSLARRSAARFFW